ncbi:MAG: hypothetical protein IJ925_01505 [Muribaculaceae bacterium]|nr:hypothetical protein [Muribaculaceae bacterium]
MRKILTFLLLLALAVPMWAGEQTITISRNDGQFDNAQGVYYASKGGVTMTMSGGMNNTNFLVLRHQNTVTFRSANFAIKKIIFHCLDDFKEGNNDVFYWGPTTMNVMTVNYKPAGSSTTTAVVPGKFTASGYDGTWVSSFSGTWTSTFRPTNGSGTETRTHTSFDNGWPAGNQLIFGSLGKPVRFSSIDIVVEKEDGDIYDLVTNVSQIQDQNNYLIVNWENAKALSVNTTEGRNSKDVRTGSPVEFIPGQIDGTNDQYAKVKTDGEAQIIKFEKHTLPISTSSGTINNSRAWTFNAGGNYLRIYSTAATNLSGNNGPDLYGESSIDPEWSYAAIWLGNSDAGYNVRIRFRDMSSTNYPRPTSSTYQIGYNRTNNYFRDLDYVNYSSATDQQVRLYTPAQNYNVTTQVLPEVQQGQDPYGTISLRDGVIVSDETATSGTSQQYETVSFLVNPANGYKISNVTIQAGSSTIEPENVTITTNGTLYTFVMPASDVKIIAEFADVQYHNIYTYVRPKTFYGNIFLTDGYVVQDNQVQSYEGENVVFNVMANLKDIANENSGYYELSYVTLKIGEGEEITIAADQLGNYNFTMPDDDVTITAYFYDDSKTPLYLLGTDNGSAWHSYGPRFNYDDETDEYYIDVYYKGNGNYGDTDGYAYGEFSVSWRIDLNDNWDNINNHGWRGCPYTDDYEMTEQYDYGLSYDNANQNKHFKIAAGIYRIKVGTQASQDKGYLALNHLSVKKYPTTLTFDPAGGADAASAVEVGQHQLVSLQGDLYNKIKDINPDEADANFMYKATVDGSTTTSESAGASTTQIATLDVVNEGETVTQLEGWNYLGWIVANNTGYYKVISTPLHWIEENGEKDKTYTVSDRLQGVYAQGSSLWCKDLGDISIVKTTPNTDQVDYLMNDNHCKREGGWDQSNWVELDFSGFGANGNSMASALVNKYIKEKTITGVYSDDVNYTITLTTAPEADGDASYVPNTYCTVNFLEGNLTLKAGDTGPAVTKDGTTTYYYFLNPKIQEYAIITYAMWDKPNHIMVIPDNTPFSGAACIGRWDLNEFDNQLTALDAAYDAPETGDNQYEFHIIVQRTGKSYGTPINSSKAVPSLKPNQTASDVIRTQPLDLKASSPLPTAITHVGTEAQVVSIEYVNVAGVRSRIPWQGMNNVVTRYSDGTITASKMIK